MPDILAIVSKSVFEKDARVSGRVVGVGDVWPVDRYNSGHKVLSPLKDGGRIFLVTVRPPNEKLWLVGVVDAPKWNGTSWLSKSANRTAVTDISALRKTIRFDSGKGMSQEKGTLGMSLQTPRGLLPSDVAQIMGVISGHAPVVVTPPPEPKRTIGGKYEVLRRLGEGGMGVVYEARHTGTGRRCAIKEIVGDDLADNPQIIERFHREARATGAIESQHIAIVQDSGTDPDTKNPYLVMELLVGDDLQQTLGKYGPLPQDIALRIVAQACQGLARAHEAGVIHRDVKPANIFLARRDAGEIVVKILDFGIARVREQLASPDERTLTTTGLMLGSPLYMSPEQVQGPKSVDQRTDLWSLAVVLYEALSGVTPHDEVETLGALLVAICARSGRPIEIVAPNVRNSVAAISRKSLALDIKNRYASAEELLFDLKKELPDGFALHESMFKDLVPIEAAALSSDLLQLAETTPVRKPRP